MWHFAFFSFLLSFYMIFFMKYTDTLAELHFGQNDTSPWVTYWSETLWAVFLASFGVPKGEKKFHRVNQTEKFEKNNHHFSEKRVNFGKKIAKNSKTILQTSFEWICFSENVTLCIVGFPKQFIVKSPNLAGLGKCWTPIWHLEKVV